MEFSVKEISPVTFLEDKNEVTLEGFSFTDKYGYCIIIVYGKNRKETTAKYLKKDA
jgi:hypothetical protein